MYFRNTIVMLRDKHWLYELIFRKWFLTCSLFFSITCIAAGQNETPKVTWGGYAQLRYKSNLNDVNSFSVRRMKLWLKSTSDFSEHWDYKVQAVLTSKQIEAFVLQDVVAFYKSGAFQFAMGQFVPHYSFQWFQPDYTVALTERAPVVNALIPNGTLGTRDIGIEGSYSGMDNKWQIWLGIFNGNGIKTYRFDNSGVLFTHKTVFNLINKSFSTGYSLMYRKADQLQLKSVLPDSATYSGNDYRFNVFALYESSKFKIQAEYLWANLNDAIARGYYVLTTINLAKNQLVASWNQYFDLIDSTDNSPIIHLGYNHLLNGDKLKIMFDNEVQLSGGRLKNYFTTLQL